MPHVSGTINTTWNVRSRVGNTKITTWTVKVRIGTVKFTTWNIKQRISGTKSASWVIDSNRLINNSEVMPDFGCKPWPTSQSPFTRLYIDHLIRGNSRVYWDMSPKFTDPAPLTFQLQTNESGLGLADESWINVGSPVINTFYAVDTQQRLYGKQLLTHYRIKLTTMRGIYYSQPTNVFGKLNKRDWTLAREITRKELLRLQRYTAIDGYLLIAKRSGTLCPCLDPLTQEVTKSRCTTCYGTSYVGGYYSPYPCTFFDLTPDDRNENTDLQARSTVDDTQKSGRFIGFPVIRSKDVFIDRDSDERYYVLRVKESATIRDVPIVVSPILIPAPYTSVIFDFPVGD